MIARRIVQTSITALAASVAAATVVGFWLSYAGLHDFAARNGLHGAEAWAWPASVDLFVIAGELGITISAIRHRKDWPAWVYLALGFGATVVFNILHAAPTMPGWGKYAVAAVPPVAAMLALAALMRQVYRLAVDQPPDLAQIAMQHEIGDDLPPWLNGSPTQPFDPDATVTMPAIHDVGDGPTRRQ